MPTVETSPHGHRVIIEEEQLTVQSTSAAGYINRLRVEESWPADLGLFDVDIIMRRHNVPSDWVDFISPGLAPLEIQEPQRFNGLLEGLGYKLVRQQFQEGGQLVTTCEADYPSVKKTNDFLKAVFDEPPLFKAYEGGEYPIMEFMKTFVREGRVLVASHQPHEVHDMSDHALAWLGLSPEIRDTLRQRLDPYVEAATLSEEKFSDFPAKDGQQERDFLNPSAVILRAMMRNIEDITGNMAQAAIFEETEPNTGLQNILMHVMGDLFSLRDPKPGGAGTLPGGILGERPDFHRIAGQILDRYSQAHEAGREMALAA